MPRIILAPLWHFLVLPLLIGTVACTKWQVQSASPQQLISERRPKKIRVTRTDHTQAVLTRPSVVNDSVYGILDESHARLDKAGSQVSRHGAREAIALGDVDEVAIRKTEPIGTSLLVASVLAAGYFAIALGNLER